MSIRLSGHPRKSKTPDTLPKRVVLCFGNVNNMLIMHAYSH